MKRFTNHLEPWGEFLDVKYWTEIKNPQKYVGKELFLGSVTDPYNPQEKIYQRTKTLLEQFQGSNIKLSIQTKSDLVLRDLELIKSYPDARVGFSINTLDEAFKDDMDRAASIECRFLAMKQFHDVGIRTTCFISPIFPGITDMQAIIDRVKGQCNLVWLENLNLRGSYKTVILDYIRVAADCTGNPWTRIFAPMQKTGDWNMCVMMTAWNVPLRHRLLLSIFSIMRRLKNLRRKIKDKMSDREAFIVVCAKRKDVYDIESIAQDFY